MSTANQMSGTAWDRSLEQTPGKEYQQNTDTGPAGRTCKPSPGQPPMKSMIDGPFGGKKPA